jgi:2-dehydro-3-deoxy-D-arabinonate dehydratase
MSALGGKFCGECNCGESARQVIFYDVKLYCTDTDCLAEHDGKYYSTGHTSLDQLVAQDNLQSYLESIIQESPSIPDPIASNRTLRPPIGSQEVWAAGVTYFRSRSARIEESKSSGDGDFYDRVYSAERPELFFKATPNRVVGHHGKVAIREDATWSVPEPELTLLVSAKGKIIGYTVGNDMSSRDIEGENPLYLPQAKVYNRSCALGPGILVSPKPLPTTQIRLEILRGGQEVFAGSTDLSQMKRDPQTLVDYLFRENVFPTGCFLLTGTGVVPPDSFTLNHTDEIRITIDGIGTLINFVG